MRLVDAYIICYYALVAGAFFTLYRGGILDRIPAQWSIAVAVFSVALGAALRVLSRKQ